MPGLASLLFDAIDLTELRQHFRRQGIQRRHLGRLHKFPPGVRQAAGINNVRPQVIVRVIAVALDRAPKTLQKLFRAGPAAAHLKVKDHDAAGHTVFPHERLVVAAGLFPRLAGQRRFVGLQITAGQQLALLRAHHRLQQAAGGQDGVGQRLAAQFDVMVVGQVGLLAIDRLMLLIFLDHQFDDELVGQFALGDDLRRYRGGGHALLGQAMRAALFPFDHLDIKTSPVRRPIPRGCHSR